MHSSQRQVMHQFVFAKRPVNQTEMLFEAFFHNDFCCDAGHVRVGHPALEEVGFCLSLLFPCKYHFIACPVEVVHTAAQRSISSSQFLSNMQVRRSSNMPT